MDYENVLEIKGLNKKYKDFNLKDVNLCLPKGCVMGFIGQNGAGKSTTIKAILNMVIKDSGDIKIFGEDHIEKESAIKENIGVVFDDIGFHEVLTPVNINKIMRQMYKKWDDAVFFSYLERFELPKKKKIGAFSRGMQMKLQIATALSHGAQLLVMDEPTGGLDPIVRSEILDVFMEFVQEEDHSILLSSHITSDLERIADYITFIDKGQIMLSEDKLTMLERHAVMKCTKKEAELVSKADYVAKKEGIYDIEFLVDDVAACRRKYPDYVIEATSLEQIMYFYCMKNRKMLNR